MKKKYSIKCFDEEKSQRKILKLVVIPLCKNQQHFIGIFKYINKKKRFLYKEETTKSIVFWVFYFKFY
jgi:hypothetical protein